MRAFIQNVVQYYQLCMDSKLRLLCEHIVVNRSLAREFSNCACCSCISLQTRFLNFESPKEAEARRRNENAKVAAGVATVDEIANPQS